MFKNELSGNKFIKNLLNMVGFIVLFSLLLGSIELWSDIMFSVGELMLFVVVSITTITYYKKYNNKFFLERLEILNFNKIKIKINLFLIVLFYSILFIILFLLLSMLFSRITIFRKILFSDKIYNKIRWNNFNYLLYFYFFFSETIIIIWFNYFLLHFIKNISFIYGIIFLLFIWIFLFGNLIVSPSTYKELPFSSFEENNYYFSWVYNKTNNTLPISETKLMINSIFMPWISFGIIGRWLPADTLELQSIYHWMNINFSSLYFGYQPNWWINHFQFTPFIILLFYILIPIFFKRKKIK